MNTGYFPHSRAVKDPFLGFSVQADGFVSDTKRNARDRLIMENLPMVGMVMHRLLAKLPPSVEADDLHSAGVLGLIDAAEKFDHGRQVHFRTYAELRVRGAMLDYLRSLNWAPRGLHRRGREVEEARLMIEQKNHRAATTDEIAREMGLSVEECHLLLADINRLRIVDNDDISDERVNPSLRSQLACAEEENPFRQLERKEMFEIISLAARSLPERLSLALRLYYLEERTLKEVGAALEVNEARASQLLSKAVSIIRQEKGRLLGQSQEEKISSRRNERSSLPATRSGRVQGMLRAASA